MKQDGLIAIFIFYNIAAGKQARLSFHAQFKHCNIVTYDGADWIMIDFDRTGILTRRIKCKDGQALIRSLPKIKDVSAIISISVNDRVKISWKPLWIRSCNEICRYASGADIGLTWNPAHLWKKLIQYRHSRNYQLLTHWRRRHGIQLGSV